ncbi:uncharacterized protein LOC144619699 isoform X3 [Crassostrea virginica]
MRQQKVLVSFLMTVTYTMQKLTLFAVMLQVCSVSSLLCGENGQLKEYDKVTQKCTNGTVEPRIPLGEPDNNTATFGGGGLVCGSGRGMFRYDTKNELCCNGTLYSVKSNVSCCHNTPFDKRFNICCGGQLRPKPELDTPVACCGTDPITDKNSLCCNGTLYSKNPNEYGCCGSKPYEFRKDRCCQDTVYKLSEKEECCKNRTFNRFEQQCYREQEVLNITDNKCGGVVYNTRVFECCGGRLHPFYKGVECCKSEAYNLSSHTCAHGHVVRKHFSWCKASGEYDPEQYGCCEGRLKRKTKWSWRCCGSELIDYDDYDCCAGKKFNKRNENCCGGRVIQKEETCCAGKVLNRPTQVCCEKTLLMEEKIIRKKNTYDDKCCSTSDGGESFDSVNFVCTMENKIVKKANQRTLCGKEEYNPSVDLCCNSRVFKNAYRDGMSCCLPNASIYNPKTHDCCHGTKIKHIRYTFIRKCKPSSKKMTLKRLCKLKEKFKIQRIKGIKLNSCLYKIRQRKVNKCQKQIKVIGKFTIQKRNKTIFYRGSIKRLSRICEKRKSKSPPK